MICMGNIDVKTPKCVIVSETNGTKYETRKYRFTRFTMDLQGPLCLLFGCNVPALYSLAYNFLPQNLNNGAGANFKPLKKARQNYPVQMPANPLIGRIQLLQSKTDYNSPRDSLGCGMQ